MFFGDTQSVVSCFNIVFTTVTCVKGKIIDFCVDMRKESQTYLQWLSIELSGDSSQQIFIPPRYLHQFFSHLCTKRLIHKFFNKHIPIFVPFQVVGTHSLVWKKKILWFILKKVFFIHQQKCM
jgi:hypothetical protein